MCKKHKIMICIDPKTNSAKLKLAGNTACCEQNYF